jgi:hypothetical protein
MFYLEILRKILPFLMWRDLNYLFSKKKKPTIYQNYKSNEKLGQIAL